MDPALVAQFGSIPAIFSPAPDGHWSDLIPDFRTKRSNGGL